MLFPSGLKPTSKTVLLIDLTGIGPKLNYRIKLFPNPTTGKVKLYATGFKDTLLIEIHDALGQRLLQQNIAESHVAQGITIDLSEFNGNIFFLDIRNNDVSRVIKVVKY